MFTRFASLLVCFALAAVWAARAEDSHVAFRASVYTEQRVEAAQPVFKLSIAGADLPVAVAGRVAPDRALLVVVDPASFSRAELRERLHALAGALAAAEPVLRPSSLRIGITVSGGVLSDPLVRSRDIGQAFDEVAARYGAALEDRHPYEPGRIADLTATLLEKAEGDGPVDCLLVARDQELDFGSPAFLGAAVERRLVQATLRKGSTLYGSLAAPALLARAIVASGGETFDEGASAAAVVSGIGNARLCGYLLEFSIARGAILEGRNDLSMAALASDAGRSPVRALRALWLCPHARPVPSCSDALNALEMLRHAAEAEKESDLAKASSLVESSMALDDAIPEVSLAAARIALAQKDRRRAAELVLRAVRTRPLSRAAALSLAETVEECGDSRAAREVARIVIGDVDVRLAARLHAAAGEYPRAVDAYRRALQEGQDPSGVCGEYGWVILKAGDADGARKALQGCRSDDVKALLAQSELASQGGNASEAMSLAQRAASLRPDDVNVRMELGKLMLQQRDWRRALRELDAAADLDPARDDVNALLVEADLEAGRIVQAERLLAGQLAEARDAGTFRRVAAIQVRLGDLADAATTLESGAAAVPDASDELFRRAGEIRERRGEYGQALLDYRAALGAAPPDRSEKITRELSSHTRFLSALIEGSGKAGAAPATPGELGSESDIIVPGGVDLLARTVSIDSGALKSRDALERLFVHILDAGGASRENALSRDLIASLKHYDALVRHLVKLNLVHSEQDLQTPQNLVFPLFGSDVAQARTVEFLSFFSVRFKPQKGDGAPSLTVQQPGKPAEERQRLLRNLGVDLTKRNLSEIRITIRNDRIPMLLGARTWAEKILGGGPEGGVLARVAASTDAMKLYVGLSRCSSGARDALVAAGLGRDLVHLAHAIVLYGRYLEFADGKLVLPGSAPAWEAVVGVSRSNPAAFLSLLVKKDQSRALLLYSGLSAASEPVRRYLTDSPARLLELYRLLAPLDATRLASWHGDAGHQDLARVLKMISVDDSGLRAPVDAQVVAQISGSGSERLDLPGLVTLMSRAQPSPAAPFYTPVDTLELIDYMRTVRPRSLEGGATAALLRNPAQVPIFLDLIWNISAKPDVLTRYIAYCEELVQAQNREWNANRTRSSQALFYLLSALRREGVLDDAAANTLLAEALGRFDTASESAFARNLAALLSDKLLPAARAATGAEAQGDLLYQALAGASRDDAFRFEGRDLRLSAAAFRAQRMKAAVQQQSVAALGKLLDAYAAISRMERAPDDDSASRELDGNLAAVAAAQRLKGFSKDNLRLVAHADIGALRDRLRSSQGKGRASAAESIAAALHVELGLALLSYCYAYNATPEIDLLTFDPHFVRKHRFYVEMPGTRSYWRTAYLDESDSNGSVMTGSLSGLDRELGRLETLQSGQSMGIDAAGIVPTLLSGLRLVPDAMRSSRAQEFVALSARLGLELAVLSREDAALRAWVLARAAGLMPPRRRELLAEWLRNPVWNADAEVLSRSELFLLGRDYLAGREAGAPGSSPAIESPVLDRLREVSAAARKGDAAAFEREVDLYGPQTQGMIGINALSFHVLESYENLERGMREQVLFERICDLRIRLAELNYALGLPPALAAFEGELAVRDIVPATAQFRSNSWKLALEQIERLSVGNVRSWIEELTNRGCLFEIAAEQADSPGKLGK